MADPQPSNTIVVPKMWLGIFLGAVLLFGAGFVVGWRFDGFQPIPPTPPGPTPSVDPTPTTPIIVDQAFQTDAGKMLEIVPKVYQNKPLTWFVPPSKNYQTSVTTAKLIFNPQVEGEYVVGCTTYVNGIVDPVYIMVKCGKGPQPPPPEPPGPKPPGPTPTPAPIPDAGFHVLIVYDSNDGKQADMVQKLTSSKAWYDYMAARKNAGDMPWRAFDKDVKFPDTSQDVWAKAMNRPRSQTPWVVISNGTTGYEGPLDSAAWDAIKKIGGN